VRKALGAPRTAGCGHQLPGLPLFFLLQRCEVVVLKFCSCGTPSQGLQMIVLASDRWGGAGKTQDHTAEASFVEAEWAPQSSRGWVEKAGWERWEK
jgi:hypothetical protein